MKKLRLLPTLIISASLIFLPGPAKADHPIGTAVVVIGIPFALVAAGAAVGFLTDSSTETETKETDDQEAETTTTNENEDSGDESRGENEGSESSAAPAKPRITINRSTVGGWFEGQETRALYTSSIPTAFAPTASASLGRSLLARKRSVPGVGVEYRDTKDEANVMLARTNIKKVEYRKTRRTNFRVVRRGALKRDLLVPIRLKVNELTVSTEDIPATSGISQSKVEVLVDQRAVYSLAATVLQGQAPVITGNLKSGEATVELRNDFGSITGLDKVIRVKIPKGKRSVDVSLEVFTSGRGEKL